LIGRKSRKARKKKEEGNSRKHPEALVNNWNAGDAAIEKKDAKGVLEITKRQE
jgi:hypothetical protein